MTKCLTIDKLTGGDITKVKEGRNSKNWSMIVKGRKLKQLDEEDRKCVKRGNKRTPLSNQTPFPEAQETQKN